MLGIAADRAGQAFEIALFEHAFLATKILDDALLRAAALAHALDQVEVGVAVDRLFADVHGVLAALEIAYCQVITKVTHNYLAAHNCSPRNSP